MKDYIFIKLFVWGEKELKNRIRYFLIFLANTLLMIFLFGENISYAFAAETVNTNEAKEKIIYLTFDDGPSYKVTDKILDILKENEVNATFFLIGNQIKGREEVVKRIYNEGHSIGLHTYTHKFNRIYCNEDKFIQEMLACQIEINNVVGISPNVIRFPGGSCKHLSKSYLNKLHSNNLKIYDWNMENADGLNPKLSPYALYKKAVEGSEKLGNITLLLHCTDMNKNTYKALPKIIKYYKAKGYQFKTITEETPEIYFPIKK